MTVLRLRTARTRHRSNVSPTPLGSEPSTCQFRPTARGFPVVDLALGNEGLERPDDGQRPAQEALAPAPQYAQVLCEEGLADSPGRPEHHQLAPTGQALDKRGGFGRRVLDGVGGPADAKQGRLGRPGPVVIGRRFIVGLWLALAPGFEQCVVQHAKFLDREAGGQVVADVLSLDRLDYRHLVHQASQLVADGAGVTPARRVPVGHDDDLGGAFQRSGVLGCPLAYAAGVAGGDPPVPHQGVGVLFAFGDEYGVAGRYRSQDFGQVVKGFAYTLGLVDPTSVAVRPALPEVLRGVADDLEQPVPSSST